ncbi:MAG: hypothetical protein A3I77_02390 [Gammaproteobacteria bacterium RIFCSPLOWO2_02_FULL_42_14]|nr:MAG: hypothetical protein A3B71_02230 [Gammaproteobacteria bacterium RIFCSPHIGHO2_02_FULL_42_43]OGT29007.1 MAG: hypothetical protein A2624_00180 [Gammaproteobacteria bacterium RIFCSPHIGHO2_01_FULL_42_8]OGT53503.1 MAG: hypothetical protein A3E54_02255 [Gammaproteobacteria bacterium RIFCSPHIGHO2_12_FULL_41_25]OGT61449.1 MAG: hypothetical protein A3I77_02390 [Gammaproteobacteria bacterium RIFCSPLOWO2_02_FULL_42_14]OGT86487.1 MAG: hypothetical protein A3G86_02525 [Gammaproteobacteria bacterium R
MHPHNEKETALAKESSRFLVSYLRSVRKQAVELKFVDSNGKLKKILIPRVAMNLLAEILQQMSSGNNILLHSVRNELTTQQAADLLNVSRPFLVKLLKNGEIPYRKVGVRRKILSKDILKYKETIDRKRRATLDELVARSQESNLGYE